jgi:hypothetical protein
LFGRLPHEIGNLPLSRYSKAKDYYILLQKGDDDDDDEAYVPGASVPVEVNL